MYNVFEICNYFINKSLRENILINPMKLQKIIYIAYGLYLVESNEKLFKEGIESGPFGPVITKVYNKTCRYGNNYINEPIGYNFSYLKKKIKNSKDLKFLCDVWDACKDINVIGLANFSNSDDSPWALTKNYDTKNCIITDDIIKNYFTKFCKNNNII